jgi:hypothetical protein
MDKVCQPSSSVDINDLISAKAFHKLFAAEVVDRFPCPRWQWSSSSLE